MIRKIIISSIAATSLILFSTQAFALINFSVGVPLSHTFNDSDVAESDGVSGTFIQVGIPILPGIGMDNYETKIKDDEVIEIRNLVNQKKPIILTLARLEERKGHKFIIKAISEIIHKFPNLLYVIAGRGPYEKI